MILLPAIDMIHHQPVRLHQGDYEQKEVVGESILSLAHLFAQQGAPFLHLVDLDGAKAGKRIHQDIVEQIAGEVAEFARWQILMIISLTVSHVSF